MGTFRWRENKKVRSIMDGLAHLRRQRIPCGVSSRNIPFSVSRSRISSARAQFFDLRDSVRSIINCSISSSSSSSACCERIPKRLIERLQLIQEKLQRGSIYPLLLQVQVRFSNKIEYRCNCIRRIEIIVHLIIKLVRNRMPGDPLMPILFR